MTPRYPPTTIIVFLVLVAACSGSPTTPAAPAATPVATTAASEPSVPSAPSVAYGANAAASRTFTHDGVTLYFETYGEGEPLLLVHGNGMSIGSLAAQIDVFKRHRKVVAMDSRDHGRSTDSAGPITYEKMTDDLAALIDDLALGPVDVVGWSDGGIEALLLGVRHPAKVRKLVSMAANLNPSTKAIYEETDALVRQMLADMPAAERNTPEGQRAVKVTGMMLKEPNIDPALLAKVSAPTLVLAGDHDLIRVEHIVEIYNHLPNAQLAIFPDSTHMVPFDNPELFNSTIERFLTTPFVKKDRIPDTMKSLEKLQAGLAN
jgi:pimeloyl-ACP methyl ester carboxylesterase